MAVNFAVEGRAFDLTKHLHTCSLPRSSSIRMCVCDICLAQCVRQGVCVVVLFAVKPNRPLYWVGISDGGVPAAACDCFYSDASLLLLSMMPALGHSLPPASHIVLPCHVYV